MNLIKHCNFGRLKLHSRDISPANWQSATILLHYYTPGWRSSKGSIPTSASTTTTCTPSIYTYIYACTFHSLCW